MSRQRRGRASSSSSTLANIANILSFERIESSAKALSVRVKQQFLQRVVGGKKNLKRISREIIGREIKRRKWIENFLLGTKLKRKYLTEDEVLTLLMFGFLVAAIALVLCVRWVFRRLILGQNRNVGEGEEEEKQETLLLTLLVTSTSAPFSISSFATSRSRHSISGVEPSCTSQHRQYTDSRVKLNFIWRRVTRCPSGIKSLTSRDKLTSAPFSISSFAFW